MPIKDAYNNVCASHVLSVIPEHEAVKVENKTLNGRVHIQTTGDPIDLVEVQCLSTYEQWETLSEASAKSTPVFVDFEGDYYDGLITGRPSRSLFNRGKRISRLYEIRFTMYINE